MTRTVTVKCPKCPEVLLSFPIHPQATVPTSTVHMCPACGQRVQVRWNGDWRHEERVIGNPTDTTRPDGYGLVRPSPRKPARAATKPRRGPKLVNPGPQPMVGRTLLDAVGSAGTA